MVREDKGIFLGIDKESLKVLLDNSIFIPTTQEEKNEVERKYQVHISKGPING